MKNLKISKKELEALKDPKILEEEIEALEKMIRFCEKCKCEHTCKGDSKLEELCANLLAKYLLWLGKNTTLEIQKGVLLQKHVYKHRITIQNKEIDEKYEKRKAIGLGEDTEFWEFNDKFWKELKAKT